MVLAFEEMENMKNNFSLAFHECEGKVDKVCKKQKNRPVLLTELASYPYFGKPEADAM